MKDDGGSGGREGEWVKRKEGKRREEKRREVKRGK
jgi:hypothetical protein